MLAGAGISEGRSPLAEADADDDSDAEDDAEDDVVLLAAVVVAVELADTVSVTVLESESEEPPQPDATSPRAKADAAKTYLLYVISPLTCSCTSVGQP